MKPVTLIHKNVKTLVISCFSFHTKTREIPSKCGNGVKCAQKLVLQLLCLLSTVSRHRPSVIDYDIDPGVR